MLTCDVFLTRNLGEVTSAVFFYCVTYLEEEEGQGGEMESGRGPLSSPCPSPVLRVASGVSPPVPAPGFPSRMSGAVKIPGKAHAERLGNSPQ